MSKQKKVLIVEDDTPHNRALTDHLTLAGFDVSAVKNGKECLEYIQNTTPDIILLDLEMPVKDGMATIEELKKDEKHKDIPVIVLTNHGEAQKISDVTAAGVYDYLLKAETSMDAVVEKIQEKIGH